MPEHDMIAPDAVYLFAPKTIELTLADQSHT